MLDLVAVPEWVLDEEITETSTFCPDTDCPSAIRSYRAELPLDDSTDQILFDLFADPGFEVVGRQRCEPGTASLANCRVDVEAEVFEVTTFVFDRAADTGDPLASRQVSIGAIEKNDIK